MVRKSDIQRFVVEYKRRGKTRYHIATGLNSASDFCVLNKIKQEKIYEATDCQAWRGDKKNTKGMSSHDVIEYMIGLLGDIKGWQEKLDLCITNVEASNWDDEEIANHLKAQSEEMMSVNM